MSYQFHGQRANEEVLLISHQHPFVLLRPFLISAVFLLLPLVLYIFLVFSLIWGVVFLICAVLAITNAWVAWHSWQNTLFLLTNERVIFLHQKGALNREFVECALPNIQQVSHEIKGLLRTVWGYGTILITTGGAQGLLMIREVPDPYELQQEIQRAVSGEAFEEDN